MPENEHDGMEKWKMPERWSAMYIHVLKLSSTVRTGPIVYVIQAKFWNTLPYPPLTV